MKKKPKLDEVKVAATVHIICANEMTKKGKQKIADWLRQQAATLEEYGHEYAPRFRARYFIR